MKEIQIDVVLRTPPLQPAKGFQSKQIIVRIINQSNRDICVEDLRLVFATDFGFPVESVKKTNTVASGSTEYWSISAELVANQLIALNATENHNILLHILCVVNNQRRYCGPWFEFSDELAYWLSAKKLQIYSKTRVGMLYKRFKKVWNSIAVVIGLGSAVLFLLRLIEYVTTF